MEKEPGRPVIGDRFHILGGDGDQHYLTNAGIMRLTTADWFPGRVGDFGEAMLFVIETGPFAGEYVALTSHVRARLADQFADRGDASTVVHRIRNPTATFAGRDDDSAPLAMAAVYRLPQPK